MLVITQKLTVGQLTFILRVIIQILTYGGLFLLGLIILGHSPRVAAVETHDILNRTVGKATATKTSLNWIKSRLWGKRRDNYTSKFLLLAVVLSLTYNLFSILSDVEFIGFKLCEVGGSSHEDFPASVKSFAEAQSMITQNLLNGTEGKDVHSYQCDAAEDQRLPVTNMKCRVCTAWRNGTYGDPATFRQLNLTDSDVLMPRLLGRYQYEFKDIFDINNYFVGPTGEPVRKVTLDRGIAIIPHDMGVRVLLGTPQLSNNHRVTLPKTMVLELEIGCLPLGIIGECVGSSLSAFDDEDYFMLDAKYQATQMAKYYGPDYMRGILSKYANQLRDRLRPTFNASDTLGDYIASINGSTTIYTWQTQAGDWLIPGSFIAGSVEFRHYLLANCTNDIHTAVNATIPPLYTRGLAPKACAIYQLKGSFYADKTVVLRHSTYICGSATQVNMASVVIAKDGNGTITAETTLLPSDMYSVEANYFDVTNAGTGPGTGPTGFGNIIRYALADNSNGSLRHFIYQRDPLVVSASSLRHGPGSMGQVLSEAGAAAMGIVFSSEDTLKVLNATYFSAGSESFNARRMATWAGGIAASYLQGSLAFNPWAALDKEALTVVSTGGVRAIGYQPLYGIAFIPLVLAAIVILLWSAFFLLDGRIMGTKRLETLYGGLTPTIVTPYPVKPNDQDILVWQSDPHPHLATVASGAPVMASESQYLITHLKTNSSYVAYDGEPSSDSK